MLKDVLASLRPVKKVDAFSLQSLELVRAEVALDSSINHAKEPGSQTGDGRTLGLVRKLAAARVTEALAVLR